MEVVRCPKGGHTLGEAREGPPPRCSCGAAVHVASARRRPWLALVRYGVLAVVLAEVPAVALHQHWPGFSVDELHAAYTDAMKGRVVRVTGIVAEVDERRSPGAFWLTLVAGEPGNPQAVRANCSGVSYGPRPFRGDRLTLEGMVTGRHDLHAGKVPGVGMPEQGAVIALERAFIAR